MVVTPEATIDECCDTLEEHKIRRVPVVAEDGRCIGIVSQADIARTSSKRKTAEVVQRVSEPSVRASSTSP